MRLSCGRDRLSERPFPAVCVPSVQIERWGSLGQGVKVGAIALGGIQRRLQYLHAWKPRELCSIWPKIPPGGHRGSIDFSSGECPGALFIGL